MSILLIVACVVAYVVIGVVLVALIDRVTDDFISDNDGGLFGVLLWPTALMAAAIITAATYAERLARRLRGGSLARPFVWLYRLVRGRPS